MNFVRKAMLVLITPVFVFLLFATAFDMGVLRVVDQPNNVKQTLADSGIYNNAVSSLLSQAKQQTSDSGTVDLTSPIIQSAANATFTPQYIEQNTNNVIDSIYAWLNGKTAQPNFSIDLSGLKDKFALAAGQAAQQKAASLPACMDETSTASALNDPVAATCLPPGVTAAAVGSEVQGDLLGGKGFLDKTAITASDIKSGNSSGQSVFANQLKNAPKQYQRIKKTPIILAIVTLLVALAIVFLSSSRRKGLRHVGVVVLLVGLFMLLLAWGLEQGITKEVPKIKLNNAVVQTDLRKVITNLGKQIDHNYWLFGGVYVLLGALVLGAAMLWGGRAKTSKAGVKAGDALEGEGQTPEDRIDLKEPDKITPVTGSPAKPRAKSSPKKTIKIQ